MSADPEAASAESAIDRAKAALEDGAGVDFGTLEKLVVA